MPPPKSLPLTLILAATPSLGIGYQAQLPWPMLKSEMAYFARVTKRLPPAPLHPPTTSKRINAVIMGRKTWESIPMKFRPLRGRLNVVVSGRGIVDTTTGKTTQDEHSQNQAHETKEEVVSEEGPIVVRSLEEALSVLSCTSRLPANLSIARTFIIGGATLYTAALSLPQTTRILLTKINKEYECDTHFAIDLEGEGSGWRRVDPQGLEEWTGEKFIGENGPRVTEKDVEFEFCLFEREGEEEGK